MNTPTFFGIDKKIFLMMSLICIVAVLTLAYRFKSDTPCTPFDIQFSSADFYAGSPVLFTAKADKNAQYEWDFGDSVKTIKAGAFETHVYNAPGQYRVYVVVNEKCEQSVMITVKPKPVLQNEILLPSFICPETAAVNTEITCIDTTKNATSEEWFIDGADKVTKTGKKITWTFRTTGLKNIYLKVNGRNDMQGMRTIRITDPESNERTALPGQKRIIHPEDNMRIKPTVDPLQPPPVPLPVNPVEIAKAPFITSDGIASKLEEVVDGRQSAADFSDYFGGNLSVEVNYNNEKMPFTQMCERLKAFKKTNRIEKPVVSLGRNEQTGCISFLVVTVKKRNIFDRTFGKKN